MSGEAKIKLLIELGTNKLKQSLSYTKKLVSDSTAELKNKLKDIQMPGIKTNMFDRSWTKAKSMFSSARNYFSKKLFDDKIEAPGISTDRLSSSIGNLKRWILAAGIGTAITAGITQSITLGLEGVKNKASFEVLGGQQKGDQLYGNLTKFAQDSIFGNELYKDAQTMLAFGVNIDRVMPRLKMLGDISMGDKNKLEMLTLAYSQNQAAGRLMGQDLLQMINAGFNPLMEMSKMTGQSLAVLKDRMEKGAISSDMVTKAFEHATSAGGMFFDMTNKIADTPFGKWEAFKGQIQGIGLQFGTMLLPAISALTDYLSAVGDQIPALIDKWGPAIAGFITNDLIPFIKFLVGAADWLYRNWYWLKEMLIILVTIRVAIFAYTKVLQLATLANNMFNLSLKATPVGWVITAITGLITVLNLLSITTADAMGDYKTIITEQAKETVDNDEITAAYESAGKAHGEAYGKALAAAFENIYANQLKQNIADMVADMGKELSKAKALATFLPNPGTAELTLASGDRVPSAKEHLDFLRNNAPGALYQAGLTGGVEAFDKVADQLRGQAKDLRKLNIDMSSEAEKMILAARKRLVSLATSAGKGSLNPDSVDATTGKVTPDPKTTSPEKVSGQAAQSKVINIKFDSYIRGDVITKNETIAGMSADQLSRFLLEHFHRLVNGTGDTY